MLKVLLYFYIIVGKFVTSQFECSLVESTSLKIELVSYCGVMDNR